MSVALITGGSAGLGLALLEALTQQGWTVVTDGRDADRLADAREPGRGSRGRRHRRPDPPGGPGHRGRTTRPAGSAGAQRQHAGTAAAAAAARADRRRPRRDLVGERRRAARADPRPAAAATRLERRADLAVVRCRGRALPDLGGVRRRQGRPRPPHRDLGGRGGSARVRRSTPATCAPPCTRRPSRARTSPIGRCRPRWCRPSWRSSGDVPPRAATALPTSCRWGCEMTVLTESRPPSSPPPTGAFAPAPAEVRGTRPGRGPAAGGRTGRHHPRPRSPTCRAPARRGRGGGEQLGHRRRERSTPSAGRGPVVLHLATPLDDGIRWRVPPDWSSRCAPLPMPPGPCWTPRWATGSRRAAWRCGCSSRTRGRLLADRSRQPALAGRDAPATSGRT